MQTSLSPFKGLQVAASEHDHEAEAKYLKEKREYVHRQKAREKKINALLAKNPDAEIDWGDAKEPQRPIDRTYWTTDATAAKLGELLATNTNGLMIERDEMSNLLRMLDDPKETQLRDLFVSGWSAKQNFRFDRIGRGTIILPKFALSVLGGIQPGPLTSHVRKAFSGENNDGFLQRFQLLVWPDLSGFKLVDRYPDKKSKEQIRELYERIDTFDGGSIGQSDEFGQNPPFIRLSPAAYEIFSGWYEPFMTNERKKAQNSAMASHLGKYPGLVGKLAIGIHVADEPCETEVSERTILKVMSWVDYLTPHAERVYHAVEQPETVVAELLLARMRNKELPPQFKAWEISSKQWKGLTDREDVKRACRLLYEYGWFVELDAGGKGGMGRPADPVYAVSPRAMA